MSAPADQPTTNANANGPFEGPEKLLEIWFAPSPADVPGAAQCTDGKYGLRTVPRAIWQDMLDIVKCQILSVVEGREMDAYLLSESSFFVSPHRLILKTCGTTLNLLGVPRILHIAREAGFPAVHRLFYSRKAFMFPERQLGPHREWKAEIEFLDNLFPNGSAYTVGKVNGDHWLLYLTAPEEERLAGSASGDTAPGSPQSISLNGHAEQDPAEEQTNADEGDDGIASDYTIEILMTHLSPEARAPFFFNSSAGDEHAHADGEGAASSARADALALSSAIGITSIFPPHMTTLDAYAFTPCGYSCNALLQRRPDAGQRPSHPGEGYYTIHVTPEDGWSYASFECNVPLAAEATNRPRSVPDLRTLVRRVVDIFRPGRLTLTLFVASGEGAGGSGSVEENEGGETAVEAAQRAFKAALTAPKSKGGGAEDTGAAGVYKRTDKINYEFGGYDLAFASFELRA